MGEMGKVERGMTLLEAVVVVAIIVVLGMVLLPLTHRARHNGRRSVCKNNLCQIAKACIAYSGNNGDFWPAQCDNFGRVSSSAIHPDANRSLALIYPAYVDDVRIFTCRSTEDRPMIRVYETGGTRLPSFGGAAKGRGPSYGYDQLSHFRDVTPSTAMLADMDGSSTTDPNTTTANHQSGQNVCYFDAHVSWASTNFASSDKYDNIYVPEPGWGADTDAVIQRTEGGR
jgi:type II secretory pathway pseudopilin PulG